MAIQRYKLNQRIKNIKSQIIGNTVGFDAVIPYINVAQAGLARERTPLAAFIFAGPTGTGKTYTVECVAEYLHKDPTKLIRIDCAEYRLEHEVAKLIGAPPGYLGHRETKPRLTQSVLNIAKSQYSDFSIVLFDEFEKGSESLQDLLLGILDKATLETGDGATVNFENTFIFFTTNHGSQTIIDNATSSFNMTHSASQNTYKIWQKRFRPEFLNRLDKIIEFDLLTDDHADKILDLHLEKLQKTFRERKGEHFPTLRVQPELYTTMLPGKSERLRYGARGIKRAIFNQITIPLSEFLNSGPYATIRFSPGSILDFSLDKEGQTVVKLEQETL